MVGTKSLSAAQHISVGLAEPHVDSNPPEAERLIMAIWELQDRCADMINAHSGDDECDCNACEAAVGMRYMLAMSESYIETTLYSFPAWSRHEAKLRAMRNGD